MYVHGRRNFFPGEARIFYWKTKNCEMLFFPLNLRKQPFMLKCYFENVKFQIARRAKATSALPSDAHVYIRIKPGLHERYWSLWIASKWAEQGLSFPVIRRPHLMSLKESQAKAWPTRCGQVNPQRVLERRNILCLSTGFPYLKWVLGIAGKLRLI